MEKSRTVPNTITVTDAEIQQFDSLIYKIIHKDIVPYWSRGGAIGKKINNTDQMDTQLGMGMDDLLQMGRLWVFQQLKWYKQFGKPDKAQLFTMVYRYLRNKFISLSTTAARQKRGGMVVNSQEIQKNVQSFINKFDHSTPVAQNKKKLVDCLAEYFHVPPRIHRALKLKTDNDKLIHYIKKLIFNDNFVNRTSYHSLDDFGNTADVNGMNPEDDFILQETIRERIKKICKQNDIRTKLSLSDYLQLSKTMKFSKRRRKS